MTRKRLQELRALADAARVGPWTVAWGTMYPYDAPEGEEAQRLAFSATHAVVKDPELRQIATVWEYQPRGAPTDDVANADFIAACREAMPELLDALEAALNRIDELERERGD